MDIAIVTGASSGLGREYVKLLDDEGLDEIWLVARRRPQLEDLAGALKTKSRLYPLDLTENGSFRILQQALTDSRAIVRYLIHAAGFDKIIMAGVQLFVALIENLPTIIVEIVKAVPQIIAGIVKAFGSLMYKIVEIGGNQERVQGLLHQTGFVRSWPDYAEHTRWKRSAGV